VKRKTWLSVALLLVLLAAAMAVWGFGMWKKTLVSESLRAAQESLPSKSVELHAGLDSVPVAVNNMDHKFFLVQSSQVIPLLWIHGGEIQSLPLFKGGEVMAVPTQEGRTTVETERVPMIAEGTKLYFLYNGEEAGEELAGKSVEQDTMGCTEADTVPLKTADGKVPYSGGFASTEPWSKSSRTSTRDANAKEVAMLRKLIVPHWKKNELSGKAVRQLSTGEFRVQALKTQPDKPEIFVVWGSAEWKISEERSNLATFFMIAEAGANGQYEITDTTTGEGSADGEAQTGQTEFIDAADLDGDGNPEIVVMTMGYEAAGYAVLSKRGNEWGVIASIDGGGC
jgi:hypothetical protein